jgi:hypothetical protein
MGPDIDDMRDLEITADIPEIFTQLVDCLAPREILSGVCWTTPWSGFGSGRYHDDGKNSVATHGR